MCIEHPLSEFKIKLIILMSLEPKHKNFEEEDKIKERVLKDLMSGTTGLYKWLLSDITFRNF